LLSSSGLIAGDPQLSDVEPAEVPERVEPLDPAVDASDAPELMQTAAQRLADGQLDDETIRLHEEIMNQLRRVMDATRQPARLPVPADTPGASSDSGSGAAGGTGDQPQGSERTSDAAESSDLPGEGELSDGEIQRRRNLATSVWGHLPPRLRDKMEGAFSERFLPQYDDLVRRYYESLATDSEEQP
jgi:hypothetical protein